MCGSDDCNIDIARECDVVELFGKASAKLAASSSEERIRLACCS